MSKELKPENIDKLAEKRLVELMKKEPVKVCMWLVIQLGKECVESHAGSLDVKTEATIGGIRYQITTVTKVKKVKKVTKPTTHE